MKRDECRAGWKRLMPQARWSCTRPLAASALISLSLPAGAAIRPGEWKERTQARIAERGMAIFGRARWITLRVRPAIEKVFDAHGLDTGEFDVLATLLRAEPPYRLRPTELFRSLMVSSGGLTNRLARLERAGLIHRDSGAADGRSLPVQLTALGRERTEAAFRDDMKVEAELLAGLSETDMKVLARLLAKLAASLPAGAAPAGDRPAGATLSRG